MQNDNNSENNVVSVTGIITEGCAFSHKVYAEGFYVFKISVPRLSENEDILPVTVSERLIDTNLLIPGTIVSIRGQIRSYNYYSDKKNRLVLTVFAREIDILESLENKDLNPNDVFLNGFICKLPVYRKTPFGREISDILVAVNRAYNKSDYIPCIAWGRNARFASTLATGDNIKLTGRMQSRKYQKKTEEALEERTAYEISISKIEKVDAEASEETE